MNGEQQNDQSSKTRVFKGEASESDGEEVETTNIVIAKRVFSDEDHEEGVVISGEASESESDEENTHTANVNDQEDSTIPPIKLTQSPEESEHKINNIQPKYDSLLQSKLREKNTALRAHLKNAVTDLYTSSTKDIQVITQQLAKSQLAIQDASHCMRLVTNDLFHLEDKLDIVATCNILPDISIPDSSLRIEEPVM